MTSQSTVAFTQIWKFGVSMFGFGICWNWRGERNRIGYQLSSKRGVWPPSYRTETTLKKECPQNMDVLKNAHPLIIIPYIRKLPCATLISTLIKNQPNNNNYNRDLKIHRIFFIKIGYGTYTGIHWLHEVEGWIHLSLSLQRFVKEEGRKVVCWIYYTKQEHHCENECGTI